MSVHHSTHPSVASALRRFAYVGTGGRVRMFLDPVPERFAHEAEIVGLCDSSLVRAEYHGNRISQRYNYAPIPIFAASEFKQMIETTRPDTIVVCTVDSEHDRYIVESLRAGCDVVTEKPMATTAAKCAHILDASRETGRSVRVTFNYRWMPGAGKVRELLAAGTIGTVRQVTMEYLLNTSHGADYFRRWHASKETSGGLLVHKSTHHFDLVNWWLNAIPEEVFAYGDLHFYGRRNAIARGDRAFISYPRYFGQTVKKDPFAYDYSDPMLDDVELEKNLYLGAAEAESGYIRDRNVFREGIDIEDTMSVLVRYRNRTLLNYSLNAYSPYEGYKVAFTGDRGRLEYQELHGAHIIGAESNPPDSLQVQEPILRVYPHFKSDYIISLPRLDGSHGGGDRLLQNQIFSRHPPDDPLERSAGPEQGAASVLIGIAANESIASGKPIVISNLVELNPASRALSELT